MWPRQLHACVTGCKSVSALWGFELVCVICTIRISAHLGKNVCNSLHLNLLMMRESVFHPQLDSSTSSKNIWYKKQQPLTRTQVHQMFNIYNFPKTPLRINFLGSGDGDVSKSERYQLRPFSTYDLRFEFRSSQRQGDGVAMGWMSAALEGLFMAVGLANI